MTREQAIEKVLDILDKLPDETGKADSAAVAGHILAAVGVDAETFEAFASQLNEPDIDELAARLDTITE